MRTTRILPFLGAVAFGLATLTGCQDSNSVAPTNTTSDDGLYRVYAIDDNAVDAYAALPATFDEAINTLTPSLDPPHRGGDSSGSGGRDSTGSGGRDSGGPPPPPPPPGRGPDDHGGLTRPTNLMGILRNLQLTDTQWVAVRGCFDDYKACVRAAMERYRAAVQDLRDSLRSEIARLKAAVDNGDLTPAEARAIYRQLLADHRATARTLKEGLRTALRSCHSDLIDCIKGVLTADQLLRWDRLTGGNG